MTRTTTINRREALGAFAAVALLGGNAHGHPPDDVAFRLATFEADVTPPLGHALMGGGIAPAKEIVDPLAIRGVILLGPEQPIVLAAIDWCEIRNDAYARWKEVLAEAAGTVPERVMLSSIHQHDAPVADLEAQRILDRHDCAGSICDIPFHERAVQAAAKAVRAALDSPRPISGIGVGKARVERVASNRRYLGPDGQPRFDRTSATRDPYARAQPEGTIDPFLRTLSFWDGDQPVAALSVYATHPMSYYGQGGVSADFVGIARQRRQEADPRVFQIYASGCSGNVTAGKYNDGNPENRARLADRIAQGMSDAWESTRRFPLSRLEFRSVPLQLEPRGGPGFTPEDLTARLAKGNRPFDQCLAALGLSWRERAVPRGTIRVPVVDFGDVQWVLLPGESYVEYQLFAQSLRRNPS